MISKKSFDLCTRQAKMGTEDSSSFDELLSEEHLLTPEDRQKKDLLANDCATRKKACKNCICGRKDLENVKIEVNQDIFQPPSGGCGSCSRGDAFRCAQCPYLGSPAWKKDATTGKVTILN